MRQSDMFHHLLTFDLGDKKKRSRMTNWLEEPSPFGTKRECDHVCVCFALTHDSKAWSIYHCRRRLVQ